MERTVAKQLEYNKKWKEAHKDKVREQHRRWRRRHPDLVRANKEKYLYRKFKKKLIEEGYLLVEGIGWVMK